MALIVTTDNQKKAITYAQALRLWHMKQGSEQPQTEQEHIVLAKVAKVILPWRRAAIDAPDYISSNLQLFIPFILTTWNVDTRGIPVSPGNKLSYNISLHFKLWEHGRKNEHLINAKPELALWTSFAATSQMT